MYHNPHLQGTERLDDQGCGNGQIPQGGGHDQGQDQWLAQQEQGVLQQGQVVVPQGQEEVVLPEQVVLVSAQEPQGQAPCFQVLLG